MTEKKITDNIKLVEKPTAEKSYRGAFYTLRSAQLIDPLDEARYNNKQRTILKSQGLVFVFTLFWSHLIDKGSFLKPTQSRIAFYAACVGIPSAIHAVYASSAMSGILADLDEKYASAYEKYYVSKIKKVSEEKN